MNQISACTGKCVWNCRMTSWTFWGKKKLAGKMVEAFPKGEKLTLFDHKWEIPTIPEGYISRKGNLSLMAVGNIHEFGEGCACPMAALAKQLI